MTTDKPNRRLAALTILASATAAMSAAEIVAAAPHDSFKDTTSCLQALNYLEQVGLVSGQRMIGAPVRWQITESGRTAQASGDITAGKARASASKKPAAKKRAAKKAAARPERDVPSYRPTTVAADDVVEPDDAETDVEEIDFALWASGVLTVQIGQNTQLLPRADAERLRDYLVNHLPRKAPTLKSEIHVGPLLGVGALLSALLAEAPQGSGPLGTLFGPANMAFSLEAHLERQREFSERTFGPGKRVDGICDHITKALIEVKESGGSLAEWVDVAMLALDGCWRSGASTAEIVAAIEAKQTKNEGRTWPDWRTAPPGKAIEHDRTADGKGSSNAGKFAEFHDQQVRDGASSLMSTPAAPIPPSAYATATDGGAGVRVEG